MLHVQDLKHSEVLKKRRARKQEKDSMPRQIFIPFDIQINILSRLPVKSLQRFRCVCKQWSSLTSTPYFIEEHYKRSSGRSPKITSRLLKKKVTLYDFDHATCDVKDSSYEIEHQDPIECKLSNSVNGLICGYDELKIRECHLINPSTREVSKLPNTPRRVSKADKVGLGFDASTGEYKVVRLLARGFDEDYECEILTVGTREWKFIGKVPLPHHSGPVYSQGALYWIVYVPQEQGGYCRAVLRIDIKYEKFEVIPLTPALRNGCCIRLHELRGRVCVVTEPEIMNIWMLENDIKWVQMLSFCTKNCLRDYSSFAGLQQLIGISGDKILLEFFTHSSVRIRCHDLQNDTCDEIWKGTDRSFFFHRESLVSPRKLIDRRAA